MICRLLPWKWPESVFLVLTKRKGDSKDEIEETSVMDRKKLTVLSMCSSYLATKSSHDTSCCAGSLNNRGITVEKCAGHSGLKSQSAIISWGMRFEERRPRLWTAKKHGKISWTLS